MRAYELMVIFDGDLDESTVAGVINQVTAQVEAADGSVVKTDKWGRRRFAYEINHKNEGFYVVFEIEAEPGALDEVDRTLRLPAGTAPPPNITPPAPRGGRTTSSATRSSGCPTPRPLAAASSAPSPRPTPGSTQRSTMPDNTV